MRANVCPDLEKSLVRDVDLVSFISSESSQQRDMHEKSTQRKDSGRTYEEYEPSIELKLDRNVLQ